MKVFKVRFNCTGFCDVVVEAKNQKQAIDEAYLHANCPSNGMEFAEFLEVEEDDIAIN